MKNTEIEQTYFNVNLNKFHYTDGIMKDRLEFLRGRIKQLTQFSYGVEKRKLALESSIAVFSLKFDQDKKIIEEQTYRSEDDISSITYFDNGKKSSVLRFFNSKNVTSKDEYQYNDIGNCIFFKEYRYDSEGKEVYTSRIYFDLNDNSYKKEIIENSISRIELFDTNFYNPLNPRPYENLGEQGYRQIIQLHDSKTIDTYDRFKNFIRSQRFDQDGNLRVEIEVTYDNEFRRKTYASYNYKDESKLISHYNYDENGFLVKSGNPNIESDIIIYENDKFGNIIKKFTRWRQTIPEEEFIYEYDNVGNWTKRTMKYREKVFNVRTRKFDYYLD